jgi:hypothetical protein
MAKRKGETVIGAVGAAIVAVHVVLAALGAVSLGEWLGGVAAGAFLILFVILHAVVGPRLGHGPTRNRPR